MLTFTPCQGKPFCATANTIDSFLASNELVIYGKTNFIHPEAATDFDRKLIQDKKVMLHKTFISRLQKTNADLVITKNKANERYLSNELFTDGKETEYFGIRVKSSQGVNSPLSAS